MPAPRPRFTLSTAAAHLRGADPVLAALIERHGAYRPRPSVDPYAALVRSVLRQQLAGAAADAIERRWHALYGTPGVAPAPNALLATTDDPSQP